MDRYLKKGSQMKRLLLILLWPPAVYCGGEPAKLERQDASVNILEEIRNSNAEITKEDATVKRTDVSKLFANDEISILTTINGQVVICDVIGCGRPATNFWIDSEVGCRSSRCDKHK
jgi:hypothetical protein